MSRSAGLGDAVQRGPRPSVSHAPMFASVLLIGAFVAGCGIGGCPDLLGQPACTHGPTARPGGLSRDAAISAARRLAPAATGTVTASAYIENDPFAPRTGLVWEVGLQGTFAAPTCPPGVIMDPEPSPASRPCVETGGNITVVLDYDTGAFLGWLSPEWGLAP